MYEPGSGKLLLRKTRLKLALGRRYALIGKNGIGKTTLLKLITSGKLKEFPDHLTVYHVHQEAPSNDTKVVDFVANSNPEFKFLDEEEERLYDQLEDEDLDEDELGYDPQERLDKLFARREDLG